MERASASSNANMVSPRVARRARAMQKWKGMVVKLVQIIKSFEEITQPHGGAAAEVPPLPGDGWRSGYAQASGLEETVPPLPVFHGRMSKQEVYAEQIKTGIRLPPRKMTKPPTQEEAGCRHPMISLAGAGNQYQREVWCQDCHARWKRKLHHADQRHHHPGQVHLQGRQRVHHQPAPEEFHHLCKV